MDISSIAGLAIALVSLLIMMHMEGLHILEVLWAPSAFVIIFGGTIGATLLNHKTEEVKKFGAMLSIAFKEIKFEPTELIEVIVSLAEKARREGVIGRNTGRMLFLQFLEA